MTYNVRYFNYLNKLVREETVRRRHGDSSLEQNYPMKKQNHDIRSVML